MKKSFKTMGPVYLVKYYFEDKCPCVGAPPCFSAILQNEL